jgi:Na+-driven multidrug efflux pump
MNFDETIQVVKKYNQEIIMFCTSFTFMFVPLLFVVSEALVLLLCSNPRKAVHINLSMDGREIDEQ